MDPVNETTRTSGAVDQRRTDVGAAGQQLKHARRQAGFLEHARQTTPPDTVVRGSGLSSTALPSASAGATERIDRIRGS